VASVQLGGGGVAMDLVGWVQQRPDDVFFFVVGLEPAARLDIGDPARAAPHGPAGHRGDRPGWPFHVVPVPRHHCPNVRGAGWGCDVHGHGFRARMLALVGPRFPERMRAFLLTVPSSTTSSRWP